MAKFDNEPCSIDSDEFEIPEEADADFVITESGLSQGVFEKQKDHKL